MRPVHALAAFAIASTLTSAQTLDRAVPDAGAPFDLVLLEGTGLGPTSAVRFTGEVGFTLGTVSIDVVPDSVTPTQVAVRVPFFGSFAGCQLSPPSTPYGRVELVGGFASTPPPLEFFFMEDPGAEVFSVGLGGTQPGGGRAVIGFDIHTGPPRIPVTGFTKAAIPCTPEQGNPNLAITLGNAVPGSFAYLYFGPLAFPFVPFGDGLLVLDPSMTGLVSALVVGPTGDGELPVPLPPTFQGELALQWALIDPGFTQVTLSNGLWGGV